MKNSLEIFNSKFEQAEERIHYSEDRIIEIMNSEEQIRKK